MIFVAASTLLANSTWETCAMTEAEMAVNAVKAQAVQGDKALAMADLIQTAVTLLRRGEALYPFNGLQGFPQNYPMLVTGDAQVRGGGDEPLRSAASILVPPDLCPSPSHPVPSPCPHPPTHTQSNAVRGSSVTVLANATELFSNLDTTMPKFSDWLQQAMGINTTATLQEFGTLWLPMPSNSTDGYDAHIVCTMHYGYTYFLQIMFILLCIIVVFQVRGGGGEG